MTALPLETVRARTRAKYQAFLAQQPTVAIETDWRTWLKAVAPRTFTGEHSDFHAAFWEWFWRTTLQLRAGASIADEEMAFLAPWPRGFGKSSHAEWAAIAEGALIGEGYVLYVSGTQALADGHVQSIRERLESPEITKYYPKLATPLIGKHGNQFGWRQDFLRTAGGWSIRPLGLDVGVRGGRVGDLRPSLIVFDDVDSFGDSPLVVQHKLDTIARAIIPAGTSKTRILFPQNLIHRNSVANQVYTRKTSILSRRVQSQVVPAFEGLQIELRQTESGPRNLITAGTPTWPDMDKAACQKFLDDSGLEAFLAEYQHDFSASEQGRVIPEYDEARHVITWSQFASVFGQRRIPEHWLCECGHDVGFTSGHLSAWTFIATSSQNSNLPGLRFRYRGLTFNGVGVDQQAEHVKSILWPGEQVKRWRMSHEALSERKTYKEKYGLPFTACDSGKTAGVSQWRHFLQADRTKPHPFHADEQLPDGSWKLGFPGWFDIVNDDQLETPRDDAGLMTHRRQTIAWRYRPDVLGVGGMSQNLPMKADEDTADSTRMVTATWAAGPTPLTENEAIDAQLPEGWRIAEAPPVGTWQHDGWAVGREWKRAQIVEERKKKNPDLDNPWLAASPFQNTPDDPFGRN
jgi:hypothetical protein